MKVTAVILIILCIGCTPKSKAPAIHISLTDSNRSVKFKGLDYAIISEINRDSVSGIWENLLPVFKMPIDTDLKNYQPMQPGRYQLKDSAVVFTPDTPFVKGQSYFIRYFEFGENSDKWAYIKGIKQLGKIPYKDLIFKQ
ncbi:MAG TPA: hypothetical protein VGN20_24020 [Mucilaginibacter sp.]|jgi:hypothetical protein